MASALDIWIGSRTHYRTARVIYERIRDSCIVAVEDATREVLYTLELEDPQLWIATADDAVLFISCNHYLGVYHSATKIQHHYDNRISCAYLALSADGTRLATANGDDIAIWDTRALEQADIAPLYRLHDSRRHIMTEIHFSHDYIYTSYDNRLVIWDIQTGAQLRNINLLVYVNALCTNDTHVFILAHKGIMIMSAHGQLLFEIACAFVDIMAIGARLYAINDAQRIYYNDDYTAKWQEYKK